jgi:DNA polymerase-3 subunit delta
MVYLFLNADEYLVAGRLAELKAALGDPELASLNIAELTPPLNPARLLAEASLMPFLAERRLLIVRGYLDSIDKRMAASKLPGGTAFQEAADLLAGLARAPETCDLVFIDSAVDKRRGLFKGMVVSGGEAHGQAERRVAGLEGLSKTGVVQLVDLPTPDAKALPAWIQQHARSRQINIQPGAVAALATFVGRNLRQLDNELQKLALYAYGRAITEQDVRAMVADASEEMIWNLTDGLCGRNGGKAMRALRELRQGDQAPLALLGAIVRQYRLLIQVKTMMERGVRAADQIAAEIGEKKSTFPVEKAQRLVGSYSFEELDAIMERLLETDMAMKTGADHDTVLDVLVADLTTRPANRSAGSPAGSPADRNPQPAHAPFPSVAHPFS